MDWKGIFGQRIFKLVSAGAVVGSAYLVQPYRPIVFVGDSMKPTYKDREWSIGTTNLDDLRIGDVVVMEGPQGTIIKRIAYLPGDWVSYTKFGGEWFYGNHKRIPKLKHPERFPTKMVRVPEGYVFVLGDNFEISNDSRQLGVLPISGIRARLVDPRAPGKIYGRTSLSN
jgi:signal peptidase I